MISPSGYYVGTGTAGRSGFFKQTVLQGAERKKQGGADKDAADHVGQPVPAAEKAEQDDQKNEPLTGDDRDAAQLRVVQAGFEFQRRGTEEGDAEHGMGGGEGGGKPAVLKDRPAVDDDLLKEEIHGQDDDVIGAEKVEILIHCGQFSAFYELQQAEEGKENGGQQGKIADDLGQFVQSVDLAGQPEEGSVQGGKTDG